MLLAGALLAFCILLAGTPSLLWADSLLLRNFVLDNQEGDMTVRFSLGVEASDAIAEQLLQGETLALYCQAALQRDREYWVDKPLAEGDLVNILKRDTKRGLFVLEQPGNVEVRARSLDQLIAEAWYSLSISLGPFSLLKRGQEYTVQLTVRLVRRDVAAWKRWTMFFSDFEVVEGASYQMNFQY